MEITENKAVPVSEWIITIILLGIPLVNIIMLFVWGFGETTHPSKKNFAKAYLIIVAAAIVLVVLFGILALVLGISLGGHSAEMTN